MIQNFVPQAATHRKSLLMQQKSFETGSLTLYLDIF